jgi:Carboxypeptidase regulatory-like domain
MSGLSRCQSVFAPFSLKTQFVAMFATLLCLFALCPASLHAQSASATSIAGIVTDSSGAVVAGANVKLTGKATNTSSTTVTNDAGRYFFANVQSGEYEIAVSKTGFRITKTIVTASIGIPLTVDLKLELGSVSETVEVTATNSELQTMSATVGNTITGAALDALPSIGGDVSTFVALQPGVAPDGSVAGAVVDQSTFMLDGGNNTNDMDGSMQVYTPSFGGDPTGIAAGTGLRGGNNSGGVPTGVMPTPSDSVEEFKVNTANQTADFNNSAGAQVEVVTKRGTNAWHGTGYEYYLDNHFNANTWDNNASGTPLPSFHYNRFGGAVGGPIIPKPILGGKTYFFFNYQGFRWNNSSTIERAVPSANMRAGILTFAGVNYNLNTGTNCGAAGTAACDPRGIGINPTVSALWALMPMPNDPNCTGSSVSGAIFGSRCDGVNEQGFKANIAIPQNDNFFVTRIDHDFGSKWHFNASYRYYKLTRATTSQVDIGGVFPGDTLGTPAAVSSRPQQPWYLVAGLTTNVTSNTTNDFHFSYLRNFWQWGDSGGAPQLAGLGGALEPLGEQHFTALTPYNVDTQDVRTRFWDGHDYFFRDDLTLLKGNHLFQFGGAYQRNWDYHQRTDNGGGINYTTTYQLGDTAGSGLVDVSATKPAGVSAVTWGRDFAAVTGIVTDAQIAYTRVGNNLTLNPPLTPAFDKSTIPYYNVYFSDSWHMKPSFTLTYGLGWTLEMPPTEQNGKQVELVDASGQDLDVQSYLKQRKAAALNGQVYNPTVGFALVGNTGPGLKYPYDPFYGSFSPRLAAAWNPTFDNGLLGKMFGHGKSVIRGGYSRVYGRLNGVDLVLVPLLGTGLIQPVQCRLANMNGTCGNPVTAANAFRIGVDGNTAPLPAASPTLPQPDFPGVNDVSAAAGESLDPHFRPNVVDSFDLTIQRQLTNKILVEFGYIGRRITHEYQPININAVPYMMTLGGQTFADAYAAVETTLGCVQSSGACGAAGKAAAVAAVTPQAFFETALANTGYCTGFASCTAAVTSKQFSNFSIQNVWSLWSALDKGGIGGGPGGTTVPGFNFQRSMLNSPLNTSTFGANGQLSSGVGVNASIGHGNYNAGFVSLKMNDWHGVTLQQNFTYSKALGTGAFVQATSAYTANDPFNLDNMYGYQAFDRKFVYNVFIVYDPPFYRSQKGFLGRALGGWSISPIFTAGSGLPLYCNTQTDAQAYGSGDGVNFFDNEQCTNTSAVTQGNSVHNGVAGGTDAFGNAIATQDCTTGSCLNVFSNPVASFGQFRAPILGVDTRRDGSGEGPIRALPYWNVDLSVKKNIRISERFSTEFQFLFLNAFNHLVFANPTLDISNPASWGVLNTQGNTPRQMEFGLRVRF